MNKAKREAKKNPFLDAKREHRDERQKLFSTIAFQQLTVVLSLLIAAGSLGGLMYLGGKSEYIPYIVERSESGATIGGGVVTEVSLADVGSSITQTEVGEFIEKARRVTPDRDLQAVFVRELYTHLTSGSSAKTKMDEWFRANNPMARSSVELVTPKITNILKQSAGTWLVDWTETTRDRAGALIREPEKMRAYITVIRANHSSSSSEFDRRKNPLGIFIDDFSWSKVTQ